MITILRLDLSWLSLRFPEEWAKIDSRVTLCSISKTRALRFKSKKRSRMRSKQSRNRAGFKYSIKKDKRKRKERQLREETELVVWLFCSKKRMCSAKMTKTC